jgi:hypothetical protein
MLSGKQQEGFSFDFDSGEIVTTFDFYAEEFAKREVEDDAKPDSLPHTTQLQQTLLYVLSQETRSTTSITSMIESIQKAAPDMRVKMKDVIGKRLNATLAQTLRAAELFNNFLASRAYAEIVALEHDISGGKVEDEHYVLKAFGDFRNSLRGFQVVLLEQIAGIENLDAFNKEQGLNIVLDPDLKRRLAVAVGGISKVVMNFT